MLRSLTLDEVVEVTGGALVDGPNVVGASGEEVCTSVSTDTRTLQPGALFVALHGETHDAHDYLVAAQEKGATGLVVDRALHLADV
jgi:UDP-N-acetylmuramoyl-tripeptide--D-alanyl-D-alanine ligase